MIDLKVKVIKGRNLTDPSKSCNAYVNVRVLKEDKTIRRDKLRTTVCSKNSNPTWNKEFSFNKVDVTDVVVFHVWNYYPMGNESLGHGLINIPTLKEMEGDVKELWISLKDKPGDIFVQITLYDGNNILTKQNSSSQLFTPPSSPSPSSSSTTPSSSTSTPTSGSEIRSRSQTQIRPQKLDEDSQKVMRIQSMIQSPLVNVRSSSNIIITDTEAQFYAGYRYFHGKGVPRDIKKAMECFTSSATQGHSDSQYYLGKIYLVGDPVQRNMKESVKWFVTSAEQGNSYAQYCLGLLYFEGTGVEKNHVESVRWYSTYFHILPIIYF